MDRNLFLSVVASVVVTGVGFAREWHDSSGQHATQADIVDFEGRKVVLKKADDTVVVVSPDQLAKDDQEYIKSDGLIKILLESAAGFYNSAYVHRAVDDGTATLGPQASSGDRKKSEIKVLKEKFKDRPLTLLLPIAEAHEPIDKGGVSLLLTFPANYLQRDSAELPTRLTKGQAQRITRDSILVVEGRMSLEVRPLEYEEPVKCPNCQAGSVWGVKKTVVTNHSGSGTEVINMRIRVPCTKCNGTGKIAARRSHDSPTFDPHQALSWPLNAETFSGKGAEAPSVQFRSSSSRFGSGFNSAFEYLDVVLSSPTMRVKNADSAFEVRAADSKTADSLR